MIKKQFGCFWHAMKMASFLNILSKTKNIVMARGHFKFPGPPRCAGAWRDFCGLVRRVWPGAREQDNVPLQIFFLTRELPVLGDKDPAHVSRGEPTSCRYEVDPKPPGH